MARTPDDEKLLALVRDKSEALNQKASELFEEFLEEELPGAPSFLTWGVSIFVLRFLFVAIHFKRIEFKSEEERDAHTKEFIEYATSHDRGFREFSDKLSAWRPGMTD